MMISWGFRCLHIIILQGLRGLRQRCYISPTYLRNIIWTASTNRNKYLVRERKRRCKRSFLGVKKFAGLPNLEKDQPTNQRTNFKYAIKRKSLARMLDGHSWEDMHQESTKQGPICYILYPLSYILSYLILSYPILSYILSHISS